MNKNQSLSHISIILKVIITIAMIDMNNGEDDDTYKN